MFYSEGSQGRGHIKVNHGIKSGRFKASMGEKLMANIKTKTLLNTC
jgi:hypothetical protein